LNPFGNALDDGRAEPARRRAHLAVRLARVCRGCALHKRGFIPHTCAAEGVRVWEFFMGRLAAAIALLAALVPGPGSAKAAILLTVDKSQQRMTVSVDGIPRYNWAISTGRAGYGTPSGIYRPQHLARKWFSKKYYNSPMPHSIFFHGGFAIHGSYEIARLGGPASHGCIRLHPANAAILFRLIGNHGSGNTHIIVRGSVRMSAKRHPRTKHRHVGRRRNAGA